VTQRLMAWSAWIALAASVSGCVTRETLPQPLSSAHKATAEVAESQLLDVGVGLFDPNVPATEKEQKSQRIDPDVRGAEARYMPVLLATTLQGTGYWGQVRVVPHGVSTFDVNIAGKILASDGQKLKLAIVATDATGLVWFSKDYDGVPDTRSYKTGTSTTRDPFQNLYVQIADDLTAARAKLKPGDFDRIRNVANLRFDSELAPYAYQGYLQQHAGTYKILRLPADDSPLGERLQQVRERDFALLDTVDDQYHLASEKMSDSYLNWRRSNYSELEQEEDLKHSAHMRMLMGAAAVLGGIAAATSNTSSVAPEIAGGVAVAAGIEAFKSGMGQASEAKAHSESIKQQNESFSAEMAPLNVDLEGKVVELRGTGEQQFLEWRRLLKELYQNETGLGVPVAGNVPTKP
jgi:hypothetical protein